MVFWFRWFLQVIRKCKEKESFLEIKTCHEIALELTALAPIEVLMLLSMIVAGISWFLVPLKRNGFLYKLGVYESFGLITIFAMIEEFYLLLRYQKYFESFAWYLTVAYVSANHFLFALHTILGSDLPAEQEQQQTIRKRVRSFCQNELNTTRRNMNKNSNNCTIKDLAGVGGFLKREEKYRSFWDKLWSFNEHRLADVWVHFGICLQSPYRLDHWLALFCHVRKYSGYPIPKQLSLPLFKFDKFGLSLDDAIDCFAHSFSGVRILGFRWFSFSLFIAELQRILLEFDVAAHHASNRKRLKRAFNVAQIAVRFRAVAAHEK